AIVKLCSHWRLRRISKSTGDMHPTTQIFHPNGTSLTMSKLANIVRSASLALSLILIAGQAQATKLSAPPLPHDRDDKDFAHAQECIIDNGASRFHRRPDYRQEEADKKKADEEAAKKAEQDKKDAVQAALKQQQQRVDQYKQQLQI